MSGENDVLAALLGGVFGHAIAKGAYAEWDGFIKAVGDRIAHLTFLKIVVPNAAFDAVPGSQKPYEEGIRAFVYGLPNASIPVLMKALELCLRNAYETKTGTKSKGKKLVDLIEWAEDLVDDLDVLHGYRLIRNRLHKEEYIKEEDVPAAIQHITRAINSLYPYVPASRQFHCNKCGKNLDVQVPSESNYIGNTVNVNCPTCHIVLPARIFV